MSYRASESMPGIHRRHWERSGALSGPPTAIWGWGNYFFINSVRSEVEFYEAAHMGGARRVGTHGAKCLRCRKFLNLS